MNESLRKWQIIGISVVLLFCWLIIVNVAYPTFQNSRLDDPFAETNSLIPYFFIVIIAFAVLCLYATWSGIGDWKLHTLLLFEFSLILWFTPYLMSGFIREPDSIWHASVGSNVGYVLAGNTTMFSRYSELYPGSYVLSKILLTSLGVDILPYIRLIFPIIYSYIVIILCYSISRKFLGGRYGFVSMLPVILGFHYIKLYPCPSTIGFVLLLTLILLLIIQRINLMYISLMTLCFLILAITYPIYPLFFLGVVLILYLTFLIYKIENKKRALRIFILIVSIPFVIWLLGVEIFGDSFDNGLLSRILDAIMVLFTGKGAGGGFAFPTILIINITAYLSYGIIMIFFVSLFILSNHRKNQGIKHNIFNIISKHGHIRTYLFCVICLSAIMTALLGMLSFTLIERGLSLFIFFSSIYILSMFRLMSRKYRHNIHTQHVARIFFKRKYPMIFFVIWVVTLAFAYPIIAYSIDSYTSIPQSENIGLEHISTVADFQDKSVHIAMPGQLAYYLEPEVNFSYYTSSYANYEELNVNILIYRNTAYYFIGMRSEASLDNNSYTRSIDNISISDDFNKVYSSSTVDVFVRN